MIDSERVWGFGRGRNHPDPIFGFIRYLVEVAALRIRAILLSTFFVNCTSWAL